MITSWFFPTCQRHADRVNCQFYNCEWCPAARVSLSSESWDSTQQLWKTHKQTYICTAIHRQWLNIAHGSKLVFSSRKVLVTMVTIRARGTNLSHQELTAQTLAASSVQLWRWCPDSVLWPVPSETAAWCPVTSHPRNAWSISTYRSEKQNKKTRVKSS